LKLHTQCPAAMFLAVSALCIGALPLLAAPPPSGDGILAGVGVGPGVNPTIFEDGFCTASGRDQTPTAATELSTGTMSCAKLMEFVYISRVKVLEQIEKLRVDAGIDEKAAPLPWRSALRILSKGSSLLSAQMHILAAIASQRTECFSEHVRLLLIVNARRTKSLVTGHVKQLWIITQDGPSEASAPLSKQLREWMTEASGLLEADLRTIQTVLRTWSPPAVDEARFYSHEADGRFSTMEALRRNTFSEWQLDKGLVQGLLRHVLPMDAVIADFGAGSGQYANWLNDTGLVVAHAFDGTPDVELVTKGAVLNADLARPLALWRKFDWAICLEVAEHIPADLSGVFLRNLDDHVADGLVLSWARPGLQGPGNTNPQNEEDVLSLVARHTKLHFDQGLTMRLRNSAQVEHLAQSMFVFLRNPRAEGSVSGDAFVEAGLPASSAPACSAEEGWIYAGNDVQMFSNILTAAACCDLCNSNTQCRYWTWSRDEAHKDLCWIKATREYRINHKGFVSGTRFDA